MSDTSRIVRIEWARLEGRRPRHAGSNARLGAHGFAVRPAIMRVTLDDGSNGFGPSNAEQDQATALLGQPFASLFKPEEGATGDGLAADFPLWDLAGRRAGQPVYALAAAAAGRPNPVPSRVPCYDTSLYIDDLDLTDDAEGAALIAAEARDGYERGHRAFKIKVGRGARHMPVEAGTRRDVAVIKAVRAAVGPDARLMIDANNGYTLNIAKRVLTETANCRLYWLEEAFHEDAALYRDLRDWLAMARLPILIADGEGQASPTLLAWARDGVIDVVQYDILSHGFTRWLATGQRLDAMGVRSAPHHYGGHLGNYTSGHLAGAIARFAFVEWDEATTPGVAAPGYTIENGEVTIPASPGFGLTLDDEAFAHAVAAGGWKLEI